LKGQRPGRLDAHRVKVLWQMLSGTDARAAYLAMGTLIAHPAQAIALFRQRLRRVSEAEGRPLRRLVAHLDSDNFDLRRKASKRLLQIPLEWVPLLHGSLNSTPPLEVYRRIEKPLAQMGVRSWSPDMLLRLRGVQILEETPPPEARRILQALAKGQT